MILLQVSNVRIVRRLPMTRKWGMWVCGSCSFTSRDAHLMALRDYALLIKPTITNRELREFLQLESASVAVKLLSRLNLPYTGSTKDRVYHLNWQDFISEFGMINDEIRTII